MATRALVFDLVGHDKSLGRTFDQMGRKSQQLGRSFAAAGDQAARATEKLRVGVDKASLHLRQAEVAASKATAAHARAVKLFGADSDQASRAALRVAGAQVRVRDATLKAADAQDALSGSAAKAHLAASRSSERWTRLGSSLRNVAKTAVFASGALAAVGVVGAARFASAGVKAAASFDQTMRQFATIADLPKAQLSGMSELALKMGADTSFAASQAGQAMLDLAKGGLTAAQIKGGVLKATLTLAAAGGIELAVAGGTMANALNMFALKASDATKVASALAGGANASTASVESLALALSQVGPGARNAGLSLNDTVGVLAAFDQAGIKGSDAGTSLKTMLSSLVPVAAPARKAMREVGLSFVDAKGNIVAITEVAQRLQDRLKGLTQAERIKALQVIFGSDATRAATVLMNQGAAGIGKYIVATKDRAAAERLAKTNTEGAAGAFEQFKGAVETISIRVGTALLPALVATTKWLGDKLIPVVAKFWKEHGPKIIAAFQQIGAFLVSTLTPAFKGLKSAFEDNKEQLAVLARLLPVVIVVITAALVSLVRATTYVVTAFGVMVRAGRAVQTVLAPVFRFVANAFLTFVGTMVRGAAMAFGWIPGIGPKLRTAAREFDKFAAGVRRSIEKEIPAAKTIKITASANLTYGQKLKEALKHPVGFATGGKVPGSHNRDDVLIRTTPGEAVVPKRLVPGVAPYLAAHGVPGFAAGGVVGGVGVSVSGNAGAFGRSVARFEHGVERLVRAAGQLAANNLAARANALGGGTGAGGWQWQIGVLRRAFPGLALISGFRPGARTHATGRQSYHALGRAVDVPPRMDVFDWIRANYGARSKELIFSPAGGRQLKNGRPHMYSGVTRADHWDHAHWAFHQGGTLPEDIMGVGRSGATYSMQRGETVSPRGGGDIHVHITGPVYGDPNALVAKVRTGIREAQRRSGVPAGQQLR